MRDVSRIPREPRLPVFREARRRDAPSGSTLGDARRAFGRGKRREWARAREDGVNYEAVCEEAAVEGVISSSLDCQCASPTTLHATRTMCASPQIRVSAHVLRLASDISADPCALWELASNSRVCRRNSFTTWMDVASVLCKGGSVEDAGGRQEECEREGEGGREVLLA